MFLISILSSQLHCDYLRHAVTSSITANATTAATTTIVLLLLLKRV
jgi:hypothetical protein